MSRPEVGAVEFTSFQSVWSFLAAGGPVMIPIALCSVAALGFALERHLRLTWRRTSPRGFDDALAAVERGDAAEAEALCAKVEAPSTRILAAGLRKRSLGYGAVERAMEEQGAREAERMRRGVRPLQLVTHLAPLLGLFGTVVGIYQAFHVVARTDALGDARLLASGIEAALITTIAGLVVAIPAIVVHHHFAGRIRGLLGRLEERLSDVPTKLAAAPEARRAA
ncbi:MAG TPA: MotA/TolQ/ExbB proton channel family protein [Planctomycetota bacterium]|nr:MotA/TolQ/ExbB proton channel family protein [Planctomycetota bacterium]